VREILAKEPEPITPEPARFTMVVRKRKGRKKAPKCKCLSPSEYAWEVLVSVPIWAIIALLVVILTPPVIDVGGASSVISYQYVSAIVHLMLR
jgi:hypothetical protein